MLMSFTTLARNLLSVGFAVALIAGATHAQAQAVRGPFATFPGSWSGGGTISLASGAVQRLRCNALYGVSNGGATLVQNLNCASDTYTFELRTLIQSIGSDITGRWSETIRNVQGTIAGRVIGSHIEATATGPGFTATLSLQARANQQQVLIRTPGSEITQISAELRRGR
jgi:hypothetical protein